MESSRDFGKKEGRVIQVNEGELKKHVAEIVRESVKALAVRYGINPKTVVKWRKRTTVKDAPMGLYI